MSDFDPFNDSPDEDFRDADFDESAEIPDIVGASPVAAGEVSGKPNRKGLYIIAASLSAFVGMWIFASYLTNREPNVVAEIPVRDGEAVATAPRENTNPDDLLGQLPSTPRTSSANELISTRSLGPLPPEPADPAENNGGTPNLDELFGPAPSPIAEPVPVAPPGDPGLVVPNSGGGNGAASFPPSGVPAGLDPNIYVEPNYGFIQTDREAILEAELRQEALRQAQAEAAEAERQRLRSTGTMIAVSQVPDPPNEALNDLLIQALGEEEGGSLAAQMEAANSAYFGPSESSGFSLGQIFSSGSQNSASITPGVRVQAVTVSEFIAGQTGAGLIEARLTSALRDKGATVLPAGTRAYGDATASGGRPGTEARVAVDFHTFVTPDGDVIRGTLTAQAADPQTMAMSVRGHVDRSLISRTLRGGAASAIDLLLTQDAQRRSVFDAPSPRDEAIRDIRNRTGDLVEADVGDETTDRNVVTLPMDTPIILIFGF